MSLHAHHFGKNLDRFETQTCTGPLFYRIIFAPADIHFARRSYWQAFTTVRNQVDTRCILGGIPIRCPPGEGEADDTGLLPAILELDCRASGEPASELSADHILNHLAAQHEIGGQLAQLRALVSNRSPLWCHAIHTSRPAAVARFLIG